MALGTSQAPVAPSSSASTHFYFLNIEILDTILLKKEKQRMRKLSHKLQSACLAGLLYGFSVIMLSPGLGPH